MFLRRTYTFTNIQQVIINYYLLIKNQWDEEKNKWDGVRPSKHLDGNNESALRCQIIWVYLTDDGCEDFWIRKYQNII